MLSRPLLREYYGLVSRLSIALLSMLASLFASAAGSTAAAGPASAPPFASALTSAVGASGGEPVLVLLGASWCAPCVAELRDLRQIAASAPGRVVIAWSDAALSRFTLPPLANVEVLAPEQAGQVFELASGRSGLPYAMMVSASGQRCADHRGRLSAEAIGAMQRTCAASKGG